MQRLLIAASAVAVAGFMAPQARPTSVRMDASVDSILEDIKGLTLVEASELVSKIEETFGVDASSAPVAMAVAGGAAAGGGDEAADEKDEFDVVLTCDSVSIFRPSDAIDATPSARWRGRGELQREERERTRRICTPSPRLLRNLAPAPTQ